MARKRSSGLVVVNVQKQLALSTLADETVLGGGVGSAFPQSVYALSAKLTWAIRGHTAGEGPILVGVAHSDLEVSEIKECIDSQWSGIWGDDLIAAEQARRPVRIVGQFSGVGTEETLGDGREIKTTLKFSVADGKALQIFAMNKSGAALTTGTIVECVGKFFLRKN